MYRYNFILSCETVAINYTREEATFIGSVYALPGRRGTVSALAHVHVKTTFHACSDGCETQYCTGSDIANYKHVASQIYDPKLSLSLRWRVRQVSEMKKVQISASRKTYGHTFSVMHVKGRFHRKLFAYSLLWAVLNDLTRASTSRALSCDLSFAMIWRIHVLQVISCFRFSSTVGYDIGKICLHTSRNVARSTRS